MDRQLANNAKLQTSNDLASGSSRQISKPSNGRVGNFYKENNIVNKSGSNRCNQSKTRNRESKSSCFKNVKHSADYLMPKVTLASDVNYQYARKHYPSNRNAAIGTFQKERFVQANCQFVVSGQNDYSEHLKDPDLSIGWEMIEEVLLTCIQHDDLYCPICLHYPTAAKITRCGHIYCWSCALHYLSLSDKNSRPCPICFHNINKLDLKSVSILKKVNHSPNDYATFNLMKIRKGCTLPVPFAFQEELDHSLNVKNNEQNSFDSYHKILISCKQHIAQLIQREKQELNKELLEYQAENMPEICFVENALQELQQRQLALQKDDDMTWDMWMLTLNPLDQDSQNQDYTYFYQCEDGQHIYLHSINIRMLKHEYQDLKYCPLSITGKIIDLHRKTVTEDIRKRFAHLRHLPISCEFTIAELEFDTSIVSQATLDEFKQEINKRKKERKRKETAQNIRDRRIEIENNKKILNLHPLPDFNINLETDFPAYELNNENELVSSSPIGDMQCSSANSSPSTSFQSSFATMLVTNNSHGFDATVRKKISPTAIPTTSVDTDDELGAANMDTVTLSDYFDQCIKINNKKDKRNKKKK